MVTRNAVGRAWQSECEQVARVCEAEEVRSRRAQWGGARTTSASNAKNPGRQFWNCTRCSNPSGFGGFICWFDSHGIRPTNPLCHCGQRSRLVVTTDPGFPGHPFYGCNLRECDCMQFVNDVFTEDAAFDAALGWINPVGLSEVGVMAWYLVCLIPPTKDGRHVEDRAKLTLPALALFEYPLLQNAFTTA